MTEEQFETLLETVGALYVQVSRMYDVMAVAFGSDKMAELIELHGNGKLITPPPFLSMDEDTQSSE